MDDTRWLAYKDTYDGFGHAVGAFAAEDGSHASVTSFTIASSRILDGLGRTRFASNPSRGPGATTNGWTRNTYDLHGRATEVASFSGDTQPPDSGTNSNWTGSVVTTYNGEVTTVRDQANKQRRSTVDGIGRLIKIEEMNEFPASTVYATTTYGYDARGNLTGVLQPNQSRSFQYDGLSRLTDANNPENGHIGYSYDLASNLTTKTDGRFTTTYLYDSLNRVTTRTYSGTPATPSVTYAYDTSTNGVGRLASVTTSGVSTYTYTTYDPMGRPTAFSQATNSQTYVMGATYNKAGMVETWTYPSGRVVNSIYDAAGRLSTAKATKERQNGVVVDVNKIYASDFSYMAHGGVGSMQLGNNLWEHTSFNARLQPTQIGLGTNSTGSTSKSVLGLDYTFGTSTSTNNGNVGTQTITVGTTGTVINQSYNYDQVNRLLIASEGTAWTQNYGYDQVGNRWVSGYVPNTTLTPTTSNHISATNNHLVMGLSHYDGSGNLDTDAAGSTFTYDGENRQVTASVSGQPAGYSYDGDGHRVMKTVGPSGSAVTTVFVYDAMGKLIAEYRSDPVPPAPNGGGTSYLTTDHLGSTRIVTKANQSVQARYDYLPFGEELGATVGPRTAAMGYSGADGTRQKFTQKERDSESGLDYFGARYYSSAQGRFTSTDPKPVTTENFVNPQRWNLYIYVNNNPLAAVDPNGGDGEGKGGDKVISVFLVMSNNDRNTTTRAGKTSTVGAPNWNATRGVAESNGYDLQVFGSPDVAGKGASPTTPEGFESALKDSEVAMYVDHGVGDTSNVPFIPTFIEVGDKGYYGGGTGKVVDQNGKKMLSPTGDKPEASASVICNFSCNSSANSDFFNNKGKGQILVTISSGKDGVTTVGTLERAANAFVRAYAQSRGSTDDRVKAGVTAANKVIQEDRRRKINRGDTVQSKRVN